MPDETRIDPELESFAEQLSQSKLPSAKIDRDQLMYDAGWAAAKASLESVPATSALNTRNGFLTSIAISFCSGVVAAAVILATMLPTGDGSEIRIASSNEAMPLRSVAPAETAPPRSAVAIENRQEANETDLLDWLDNLPQGHTISSGFSSKSTSIASSDEQSFGIKDAVSPASLPSRTSRQLMQELIPEAQRQRTIPTWTAWVGISL